MKNWKYKRLSECSNFISERTSNITIDNYISTENMIENRGGVKIASTLPDVKSTSAYKPNDILLSNIRPYFCKIWFADKKGSCSNDVLVVRAKKEIDPKFLYYVLSDQNFFNWDSITSKGTKMPRGTPNAIMKYSVPDIPLPTQQKIASILSAYDNLIQNYKKQIEALQTAASELCKEWFVRFRFPGYQTTNFENGIPEGWNYKRIFELYNTTSGGTPARTNSSYYENGTIPWVKTGELLDTLITDTEEYITEEGLKNSSAKIIEPGSLLCSMYAGVGKLGINVIPMTCSQATCVFTPKSNISIWYLFFWLMRNKEYLESISFGAAQQNISQDIIKKITVLFPSESVTLSFDEKIKPIYKKIQNLMQQISNLTQQRDLLLPRLMTGKLEV